MTAAGKALDENQTTPTSVDKVSSFVRSDVYREISKQVIRKKLAKQKHLYLKEAICTTYLDSIFDDLERLFDPQTVYYNGGIANIPEWKISCYLEVMPNGVPTTCPNMSLLALMSPLLEQCNRFFWHWYLQQHACNTNNNKQIPTRCSRLMTFVTRYTPAPGEQALLKHVDGAGKVDGSLVLALPTKQPFTGGGLTVWDGKDGTNKKQTLETHYDTRSGDVVLLDR
jgi:hypothetical protein